MEESLTKMVDSLLLEVIELEGVLANRTNERVEGQFGLDAPKRTKRGGSEVGKEETNGISHVWDELVELQQRSNLVSSFS